MNVFYIGNNIDGCYYVRCLQPLIYNGWYGEKVSLRDKKKTTQEAVKMAMEADVVVFQRPDDDLRLVAAQKLKAMGKKIVFENDDTYKNITDDATLLKYLKGMDESLDKFMEVADMVTTTTDYLADEYREINKNVYVLPNCVDPDDWEEPIRNEGVKVRIGLVGSVANNNDFKKIVPLLDKLGERDDIELVLFGLPPKDERTEDIVQNIFKEEYKFWLGRNIEWQHTVPIADYFDTLNELRLDIMLIPRQDNYFNRCKSNVKFLEAAMCEIPVIAQGFPDKLSPYDKDLNGKNGIICLTEEDWVRETERLIQDTELRRKIGKEAKNYVLKHYCIQDKYKLWADAYKTLYEN